MCVCVLMCVFVYNISEKGDVILSKTLIWMIF